MNFAQKSNRGRHLLKINQGKSANNSLFENAPSDDKCTLPSFVSAVGDTIIVEKFPEKLNSTFLSNDIEIVDVNFSIADL